MYLKKILLAIAAVVIAVVVATPSTANAHDLDYNFGVMDTCKQPGYAKIFDNDLTTSALLGSNQDIGLCGLTLKMSGFYYNVQMPSYDAIFRIIFGHKGATVHMIELSTKNTKKAEYVTFATPILVDEIIFSASGIPNIYEFDVFRADAIKYEPVKDIQITTADRSATISFTPPSVNGYVKTAVFLNGASYADSDGNIVINSLKPNTKYSVNLQTQYNDGYKLDTVKEFTTLADTTPPADVVALNATIVNKKDVKLTYVLPTDKDFSHLEIYRGDKLLTDSHKESSYTDTTTTHDNSYTYKIVTVDTTGNKSSGVSKTIKTSGQTADNVSNLYAAIDGKKDVKLSYKLAGDTSYVQIYRDDKLLVDNYKETSYTDKNTAYNTSYVYKVVAVNSAGIVATGTSKTIKTPQSPPKDASSLSYTATSNSVSLKWRNTTLDDFTAVTIYRKNNTVAANVRALFSAGDGYTKLHSGKVETYTDNSVEPDTSYKYKITTIIAGVESDGVTVDVKTKPVTLDDTTLEQQPNGDYVVTWGAPTTGKMQINVGGTKYAVVPAANKTFTVPAADVKFNVLGSPDVQLVPLNDAEQPVGPGTKPGGGGLGSIIGGGGGEGIFDAPDLVKAAASLLALVGGFILLGLAFRVVPMLVKTIRNAFISGGAKR